MRSAIQPSVPHLPEPLERGYGRFRTGRYPAERDRYRQLGEGVQRPQAMVVACSDSRSAPEIVFDAAPGELFVVRNVAGLVPGYAPDGRSHAASAALEYAIIGLEVRAIIVMGHGRCGGIRAALEPASPLSATDFIGPWVTGLRELAEGLDPSAASDPGERLRAIEYRSVERSIANLRTFPWIASREASGALRLHAAWFDISLGELHVPTSAGWRRLPEI